LQPKRNARDDRPERTIGSTDLDSEAPARERGAVEHEGFNLHASESDEPARTRLETPRTTWLVGTMFGFRIPIGWPNPEPGAVRGSLLVGLGFAHLAHARDEETFFQGGVGGEIVF
jgi:hypothetical protein